MRSLLSAWWPKLCFVLARTAPRKIFRAPGGVSDKTAGKDVYESSIEACWGALSFGCGACASCPALLICCEEEPCSQIALASRLSAVARRLSAVAARRAERRSRVVVVLLFSPILSLSITQAVENGASHGSCRPGSIVRLLPRKTVCPADAAARGEREGRDEKWESPKGGSQTARVLWRGVCWPPKRQPA